MQFPYIIPTFSGLVASSKDAALQANLKNAYVAYTADVADDVNYLGQDKVIFKYDGKFYEYNTVASESPKKEVGKYYEKIDVVESGESATVELVGNNVEKSTYNNCVAYKAKD